MSAATLELGLYLALIVPVAIVFRYTIRLTGDEPEWEYPNALAVLGGLIWPMTVPLGIAAGAFAALVWLIRRLFPDDDR